MLDSRSFYFAVKAGGGSGREIYKDNLFLMSSEQNVRIKYEGGIFMKRKSLLKWLTSAAFTALMAAAVIPASAGAEWRQVDRMGDLNGDGAVNVADIVTLTRHLLGKEKLSSTGTYSIGNSYYIIGSVADKNSLSAAGA
jgi:hypothetical protein